VRGVQRTPLLGRTGTPPRAPGGCSSRRGS